MESVESGDSLSEKFSFNISEVKENLHEIKFLTEQVISIKMFNRKSLMEFIKTITIVVEYI